MADFTKEEVLALALLHETSAGRAERGELPAIAREHNIRATALRVLAKSMDAVTTMSDVPVGYMSEDGAKYLANEMDARLRKQADGRFTIPLYAAPPASAPAGPVAVKVKPLQWYDAENVGFGPRKAADCLVGRYLITLDNDAAYLNDRLIGTGILTAEADYERRIRSALAEQPAPVEAVAAVPAGWIDKVMEQAQVFASCYSLVGGKFDDGSRMAQSEEEKAALRALLAGAPPPPARQIGEGR